MQKSTNPFLKIGYYIIALSLFFIVSVQTSCESRSSLFSRLKSSETGITFNNVVTENDSINPIDLEFLYNGGGVAAADFNNDGRCDLYFTASMTSNKLYLNQGDFRFRDVTEAAGVTGNGRWANAVSVVDINNDGLMDMYVTNTINKAGTKRANFLYVNQGAGSDGLPKFRDMAAEYNLADTSYSVHAAFFDYDQDGDLDMYLLTTKLAQRESSRFSDNNRDTVHLDHDKLLRNDWNQQLNHPVFTDVSASAGIGHAGYGLGLAVADINKDGWKDIYVTNDFFGSDHLYISNRNGTFTDKITQCLKHTSQNAMGNDMADINNDGLADIVAVDMNPEDNFRKKKNMNGNNYNLYQNMVIGGFSIQYVKNTLQLNMGPQVHEGDSLGDPVFSDISFFSGVAETDWSWNPSLADFDNDGLRDLIVTNGYPRDVTDHDFAAFRGEMGDVATKEQLIELMPQIKIANYAFKNKNGLKFENVTASWGMNDPSFSNGAVYADLDNDGDLDYVINNINDEAFVYRNDLNTPKQVRKKFLRVSFEGPQQNVNGLGAFVEIFGKGTYQIYENFPYRGYLSSVESKAHFGTDTLSVLDSVKVVWPDGRQQVVRGVATNQELKLSYKNATAASAPTLGATTLFTDITKQSGIDYIHRETDFIDFNQQRLLPHKLSQYGPGMSAGDLDGDGADDLYVGGTSEYPGKFLFQTSDGKFEVAPLPKMEGKDVRYPEDMGILFFDADNDSDLDIYFASGSNESPANSKNYADRFLRNDGGRKFSWDSAALPANYASKSCVKAEDFDKDGDLDLFIGVRVVPQKYPEPATSYIYRNDSKNGEIRFTDVTMQIAPALQNIGLVCDALWTDVDGDNWKDLMIVGEWMPVTVLKNNNGKLSNITESTGVQNKIGWWNSLSGGDFDNDGDIDYVAGNLGTNSYFRGNEQYPVSLYAGDFDKNKGYDIIPTIFLPDQNGKMKEYSAHTRDDVVEQLPSLKKKFLTYKDFANADFNTMFTEQERKAVIVKRANFFESVLIRNNGGGKFEFVSLPFEAQIAPVYGMVSDDFNADGNLDVLIVGNDFGNEVGSGRYDALNGLMLAGNGKGAFKSLRTNESGFFVPGDGKALLKLKSGSGEYMVAASENRGPVKLFKSKAAGRTQPLPSGAYQIMYTLSDGRKRMEEVYLGHSFLSQSSPFISFNKSIAKIEITDRNGRKSVYEK
jgi:hypothetical protein